jgi:hypothetical protein
MRVARWAKAATEKTARNEMTAIKIKPFFILFEVGGCAPASFVSIDN